MFRGFLVVARPADDNSGAPVGSFAVTNYNSTNNTPISQARCSEVSVLCVSVLCLSEF